MVFSPSPEPRVGFPACSPDAGTAGQLSSQQSWFISNEVLPSLFCACCVSFGVSWGLYVSQMQPGSFGYGFFMS